MLDLKFSIVSLSEKWNQHILTLPDNIIIIIKTDTNKLTQELKSSFQTIYTTATQQEAL